ncbi:MAG: hypothetical protein FWC75_00205 [Oscillospiraceae bacterium]|nr:hypothetical protein [Oscillospiraceae bacterium]
MFKKSKSLLVITLALLICLGSVLPALASELNQSGALVGTESNPVEATITKQLRMPVETTTPNVVFNFLATKISVDGETSAEDLARMPELANLIASFSTSDTTPTFTVNNVMSFMKETGNIFDDVTFPHAGIFVYQITEVHPEDAEEDDEDNEEATGGIPHETMRYSTAVYTLTVYVSNTADGKGTYVSGLGTVVSSTDLDTQAEGSKVDPTPGGNGEEYFFSQMIFTNDFVRTNGADDPRNPDPVNESTLSISKEVEGELASREQYFQFDITLNIPFIVTNVPTYYRAYVVQGGAVIDPSNNVYRAADSGNDEDEDEDETAGADISALIGTDAGGTYIKIASNATTTFFLKDGQRLVFVDTPVGTSYDVTESAATHYVPRFSITTDGTKAAEVPGSLNTALATTEQFVGERANSADFTNFRDFIAPTGLSLNDLPFIGLIALALGTLIIFILAKTRRRHYDR